MMVSLGPGFPAPIIPRAQEARASGLCPLKEKNWSKL
jgi:hypothetical protein